MRAPFGTRSIHTEQEAATFDALAAHWRAPTSSGSIRSGSTTISRYGWGGGAIDASGKRAGRPKGRIALRTSYLLERPGSISSPPVCLPSSRYCLVTLPEGLSVSQGETAARRLQTAGTLG